MASSSRDTTGTAAKISGCTCFRLRKLTRRITQHYDTHLAPAGLRVTQFSLLATLSRAEPMTITALAGQMEMDRTTLTRNLRPLEAAGWIQLAAGKDARSRTVALTDAGNRALDTARPYWRAAQEAVNDLFGPDRVVALHDLLDDSVGLIHGAAETA